MIPSSVFHAWLYSNLFFCPLQVYKLSSTPSWWRWFLWLTSCCLSCLSLLFMQSLVLNFSLAFFIRPASTILQVSGNSKWFSIWRQLKLCHMCHYSECCLCQGRCLTSQHLVEVSTSVPRARCVTSTGRGRSTGSPTLTTSGRACWPCSSASLSRAGPTCSTGCTTPRAGPGSGSILSPWLYLVPSSSWTWFSVSSLENSPRKEKRHSPGVISRNSEPKCRWMRIYRVTWTGSQGYKNELFENLFIIHPDLYSGWGSRTSNGSTKCS